jgi:peptidoglycan hydrolase CwlO-like protein
MKKTILTAIVVTSISFFSCEGQKKDSKSTEETKVQNTEATVDVSEIEKTTNQLSSDVDHLNTSTEETKKELDELLNDL